MRSTVSTPSDLLVIFSSPSTAWRPIPIVRVAPSCLATPVHLRCRRARDSRHKTRPAATVATASVQARDAGARDRCRRMPGRRQSRCGQFARRGDGIVSSRRPPGWFRRLNVQAQRPEARQHRRACIPLDADRRMRACLAETVLHDSTVLVDCLAGFPASIPSPQTFRQQQQPGGIINGEFTQQPRAPLLGRGR